MLEINRQPLIQTPSWAHTPQHYWDEDVSRREDFPPMADGTRASIIHYTHKETRRVTSWKIAVIVLMPDGNVRWAGSCTVFDGRHNAYVRGPTSATGQQPSIKITSLPSKAEALDFLRWATARLYA